MDETTRCTAFEGARLIATGPLADVALTVKTLLDRGTQRPVLIFDDATGGPIDIDTRGTPEDMLRRLRKTESPRGPGRPRMGVRSREITLLPRHWDWLNDQPGGASAAIRRLIDDARRNAGGKDAARTAQNAAYRFMTAMAGDEPDYEDAIRALFAGRKREMLACIEPWPANIRDHVIRLSAPAFAQ